jgi:DNA helicase-2/ATP-dependent DNA helicase PcrA
MNEQLQFQAPEITDDDIHRISRLLGLGENAFHGDDGRDPRAEVLKSMTPMDVAACPGSGKTTLLVAKLAILAEKWRQLTRGICVLSHTNAAREQIESRLGIPSAGRRLLSYPHFVGTIHAFVNEFLALPWLRSLGHPIRVIDTERTLVRRWKSLPFGTRQALEKNGHGPSILFMKSPDFGVGEVRWGKSRTLLGNETQTYKQLREACRLSVGAGYYCYDEMFLWARDLIEKIGATVETLRDRFPLLFIDEAQDNTEEQSAILSHIFMEGGQSVVRQRFGDMNQAIFDSVESVEPSTDKFPIETIRKDIPNSHRFGQKIADLADPLGLHRYQSGLRGLGGNAKLFAPGLEEARHTIFLFDKNSAARVIDAYGELLFETFSEQGLGEGKFAVVGHVHRPPEAEKDHKFPHYVGQYWPEYDPELSKLDPKPKTFAQYVFAGLGKAKVAGETLIAVEMIAEGILRLAEMGEKSPSFEHRRHVHRYILTLLEQHPEVRGRYIDMMTRLALETVTLTKETWHDRWSSVVREFAQTIAKSALLSSEVKDFLEWDEAPALDESKSAAPKSRDNIYLFSRNGKQVTIQVGSIHSIKGQTHTATMVLETFWQDKKGRHNLELLLPWLMGSKLGSESAGSQQRFRLRLHYVAMTRPTQLLCLAMKKSSFADANGDLEQELLSKLEARGWHVKVL